MFNISYSLTLDDFRQLAGIFAKRVRDEGTLQWTSGSKWWLAAATSFCVLLSLAVLILGGQYGWLDKLTALYSTIALLIGIAAGTLLFFLYATGSRIDLVRHNGPLTGSAQLTTTDSGISVERPLLRMEYEWSAIEAASSDQGYIVLWLEPSFSELIPHRAFSTPEERNAFYDFVLARLSDRNARDTA